MTQWLLVVTFLALQPGGEIGASALSPTMTPDEATCQELKKGVNRESVSIMTNIVPSGIVGFRSTCVPIQVIADEGKA